MHLILLPTYNERENISALLDALSGIPDVHVLVIDDTSPDGTAGEVRAHTLFNDRIFLLLRGEKNGLGAAYRAGFAWGMERDYETFTQMDADFSHDPKDLPRLFEKISTGADLVLGSRKISGGRIEGWNMWRTFCSAGAMTASRVCLGLRVKDVTSGFRTWQRSFLQRLPVRTLQSSGYAFQEEMLFEAERAGGNIVEIPVVFRDRVHGVSKLGFDDIGDFFSTLFRLTIYRRKRFLRFALVGALGACIDVGCFIFFHHILRFDIIPANILSITLAIIHNFSWHHAMTFKNHGREAYGAFGFFVLISLGGMVINTFLVVLATAYGVFPVVAKICAIGVVMLWNYFLNSRVTFRK